jgi:transcriptional regulator with XRE-family HTH domain
MGATIRALRGHAHISQIALGERVAMHHNYLGAIERGEIRNPGLETVDRIAAGLGVSIAVLARSYADASEEAALGIEATGGRPRRLSSNYDAKALGAAIRIARRRLGLTQTRLADIVGLHRNHLGSIEAGATSSRGIATIARVAQALTEQLAVEAPLLPLLAQTFTAEATLADVREAVASEGSN